MIIFLASFFKTLKKTDKQKKKNILLVDMAYGQVKTPCRLRISDFKFYGRPYCMYFTVLYVTVYYGKQCYSTVLYSAV